MLYATIAPGRHAVNRLAPGGIVRIIDVALGGGIVADQPP